MTSVERAAGRRKQSVAEASFDAWIKYYRQDENAPNAIVSYYVKGSLIALALDLTVRRATRGRRSLDDVMRALWTEYGCTGRGVGEEEIETLAQRVTGVDLRRFFDRALRSTADWRWEPLLAAFGLHVSRFPAQSGSDRGGQAPPGAMPPRAVLGARVEPAGNDVKLAQVFDGGAAQAAGFSAGDVAIALNGLRLTPGNWEQVLGRHRPGTVVRLTAFRRDELIERRVRLKAAPRDTYALAIDPHSTAAQRRLLDGWLQGPPAEN
jgi:predicted metalloprotease with PDZ domain